VAPSERTQARTIDATGQAMAGDKPHENKRDNRQVAATFRPLV
jgi:hypothetical protein